MPGAGSGLSYDRYAYVKNNPIKLVDPSGHGECDRDDTGCQEAVRILEQLSQYGITPIGSTTTYNQSLLKAAKVEAQNLFAFTIENNITAYGDNPISVYKNTHGDTIFKFGTLTDESGNPTDICETTLNTVECGALPIVRPF